MLRALLYAAGLFVAAVALGGPAPLPEFAENTAAECVYVDDVGCLPNVDCVVAAALEAATGRPFACTL